MEEVGVWLEEIAASFEVVKVWLEEVRASFEEGRDPSGYGRAEAKILKVKREPVSCYFKCSAFHFMAVSIRTRPLG